MKTITIRITGATIVVIALIAISIYSHLCWWTISTICSVIFIRLLDKYYCDECKNCNDRIHCKDCDGVKNDKK